MQRFDSRQAQITKHLRPDIDFFLPDMGAGLQKPALAPEKGGDPLGEVRRCKPVPARVIYIMLYSCVAKRCSASFSNFVPGRP